VTLSNDQVLAALNRHFVCAWKNIKGADAWVGTSNTHQPSNPAIEVTNCAGHHNVQMFFLTADGRVLHGLPGYWNPRHFLKEVDLAIELAKLYYRKDVSAAERNATFLDLHLRHALEHPAEVREASHHQGFDKMNLEKRFESDFHRKDGFIASGLKTPDQVLHERLAATPYRPFASFNVRQFVDMGQRQYSYDHGLEGKTCPKTGKPMNGGSTTECEKEKHGKSPQP
jgi:hypothetical protein